MSAQLQTIILPKSQVRMFYRELGERIHEKTILLLHGFPSSSHQYRKLMPLLAAKYRVVAPDLPGFGFTEVPKEFKYSFETLTDTIEEFLDAISLSKFSVYIFDYGAPVGLRLALRRTDAIEAIISQNGNAYVEGFGDVWGPIQAFWASKNTAADRAKVADAMLTYDITKFQYLNGTPDPSSIAPESYTLDYALMERLGNKDVQLDLFMDYQNNVALYEKFQEYFRSSQLPLLAIWGKNDVFFIPSGAEAYKKDLPRAQVKFLDAGHFASESHAEEIADEIISFLG
ncbi:Putative Hydrolase-like protein [Penicillium brasilianum]|uniref:Putative Hydrolase-like protein n=1 Tax=Penicillium brasilianum TaxID=104259 RepID=A0A0F7VFE5_PENBI|nr:Putative Hydrolase-like protein [Penicillium brasilianum]